MRRLILKSMLSPGDIVMLTACVRDLQRAHPGQYQVDVRTPCPELWQNNPHLTKLKDNDAEFIEMHYPAIGQANQVPGHFVSGYSAYLESLLHVRIPTTEFRGDIHLSEEEKRKPTIEPGYWIIVNGGKCEYSSKWANPEHNQKVVDHFRGSLRFVQVGVTSRKPKGGDPGHWHEPLEGVTNLIGKTGLRDLVRLTHFAAGVLCPVTLMMHLAAAVPCPANMPASRPCVVVAGGREPPNWEAYPGHQFISTLGWLKCCSPRMEKDGRINSGACWKDRCQLMGDGDRKDTVNLCEQPVQIRPDLRIPRCMDMIGPEEVIRRIEGYYSDRPLKRNIARSNGSMVDAVKQRIASGKPCRAAFWFRGDDGKTVLVKETW